MMWSPPEQIVVEVDLAPEHCKRPALPVAGHVIRLTAIIEWIFAMHAAPIGHASRITKWIAHWITKLIACGVIAL